MKIVEFDPYTGVATFALNEAESALIQSSQVTGWSIQEKDEPK